MIHKSNMIVLSCFLGRCFLHLVQLLANQQTEEMKNSARVCTPGLLLCARTKDKHEEYEVSSGRIFLDYMKFETALGFI